jgi:predicted transcriptional regulator
MEKLTEEQRLAVIAQAVDNSQSIMPSQSVEDFISDLKAEQIVVEHGLLDSQKEDVEDESQFLFTDSAEEIDEEDEDMGLSDEMKGIYS